MNGPEKRLTAKLLRVVYDPLPRSGNRPGIYAGLRMMQPAICLALPIIARAEARADYRLRRQGP